MALIQQIEQALLEARKAKDSKLLAPLRLLKAAIKNKEIELRKKELSEAEVIALVRSEVKKRREAITDFTQGGREDLATKEKAEAEYLGKFLPPALDEGAIKERALAVINSLPDAEKKNFGKVMASVMADLAGQAEGATVSRILKELLAQ